MMIRSLLTASLLLATVSTSFAQLALFTAKLDQPAQPNVVKLTVNPKNRMQLIDLKLNGIPCTFLLDTGASHTTVDRAFMKTVFPKIERTPIDLSQEGCSTNVNPDTVPEYFSVESLTIGNTTLRNFLAVCMPLPQLTEAIGRPIHGILGMNTLVYAPFILSTRQKTISWCPPAPKQTVTGPIPALQIPEEARFFIAGTPSMTTSPMPLLLDSGATWTFFDPSFWPKGDAPAATFMATSVNESAIKDNPAGKVAPLYVTGGTLPLKPLLSPNDYLIGADLLDTYDWFFNTTNHTFQLVK